MSYINTHTSIYYISHVCVLNFKLSGPFNPASTKQTNWVAKSFEFKEFFFHWEIIDLKC